MKNRSLGLKAMIGASALLIFTSPSFADDTKTQAQRRGGVSGQIDQKLGDGRGQVSPATPTPIDAPIEAPIEAPAEPAPVAPAQRAQQGNQVAPSTPSETPILEPSDSLGEEPEVIDAEVAPAAPIQRQQGAPQLELGADAPLPPGQAVLGETQTLEPSAPAQQGVQQEAAKEKKPGFFKRMWTKVKTFFGNVKNKITKKKPADTIAPAPELSPGGEGSVGSSPVG